MNLRLFLTILKNIESGKWDLINSDAIIYEINQIPDTERKNKARLLLTNTNFYLKTDDTILSRAKEIKKLGIKSYDALHVASAEAGNADIFLSTDDNLLNKLKKHFDCIKVKTENPLTWIKEVI